MKTKLTTESVAVVFRQAASGRTWEVRTADRNSDVVGMIGLRDDGIYSVVRHDPSNGFKTDALDTLEQAQAYFTK